jgi:ABC-type transporter Mla subunit MlaD
MTAKTHFKIGVFVVTAVALGAGGVVWLGAGAALRPKVLAETYLDESVQGLEVGSPVKYRGVQIGRVEGIGFVSEAYALPPDDHTHGRFVMVKVSLSPSVFRTRKMQDVPHLVTEGLRVRLSSAGLTGIAYLEVDYMDPERHPPMPISWTPATLYVPSAPSTAVRLTDAADRILEQIEEAQLDEVAKDVRAMVQEVSRTMKEDLAPAVRNIRDGTKDLPATIEQVKKTAAEMEQTVARLRASVDGDLAPAFANLNAASRDLGTTVTNVNAASKELGPAVTAMKEAATEIRGVAKDLPATLSQANRTLKQIDHLATGQQDAIEGIFENLRMLSADLRELSSTVKRYPSHAFFGNPPARKDR